MRNFTLLYKPVRDHCHLTGLYRAPLCNDCNLKRQNHKFIPIFIHASSNYDSHFIIRQLGCDNQNIHVIPNSTEKYISFSKKTVNGITIRSVSYTHLDVYKRQVLTAQSLLAPPLTQST